MVTKIRILTHTHSTYQQCTNHRLVFCNNSLLVTTVGLASRSLVSFVFIHSYHLSYVDAISIRTTLVMFRSSPTGSGNRLTSIPPLSFLHDFYHCVNIAAIYQFNCSFGNNHS